MKLISIPRLLPAGLLLLAACNPAATAPPVQVAEYHGADDEATLTAFARQQVPHPRQAVLYFYADWCGPCRRFRAALADAQVATALQPAALVKLNVDDYPALAASYGITAIPAFLKVDAEGRVAAHITSDKWAEDTPANIASVLRGLLGTAYDGQ